MWGGRPRPRPAPWPACQQADEDSAAVQGDRPTPAARSPDIAPPGTSSRQAPAHVGIKQIFALPARFRGDASGGVEEAPRPPAIVRIGALPLLQAARAPPCLDTGLTSCLVGHVPLLLPIRVSEPLLSIQAKVRRGLRSALEYPPFVQLDVALRFALGSHNMNHAVGRLRGGDVSHGLDAGEDARLPRCALVVAERDERAVALRPGRLAAEQIGDEEEPP